MEMGFVELQKDWRGAEEHIKEALKITDRYFNDISPRAARIFINLARVYRDQVRNRVSKWSCSEWISNFQTWICHRSDTKKPLQLIKRRKRSVTSCSPAPEKLATA